MSRAAIGLLAFLLIPAPRADAAPPAPRAADPAAEPLDDPTLVVPGSLEPAIEVIDRDPSNWLGIPPEREWLNAVRDPLRRFDERHGLAITGAYTVLYQHSVGPDAQGAAAGDFDLVARWTPIGRGTADTGSFYVAAEWRHQFGSRVPSALGSEIGTLLATTNGFSDRGLVVKDAYYVQRLFEDRLRVGFGRVDAENLFANHLLQSANTSFLNKAFSTNPTVALPGVGAGAALSVRPVDWFYVAGGANNAYGNTEAVTADLLDELRFFKYGEIGFTPSLEGVGDGRYRVAVWHMDSRSDTGQPADEGFSLIIDQAFGERVTTFARYGYATGDLTGVKQSIQAGGAVTGLVGSAADLTGLAFAWSQPEADLPDEEVLEIFHRLQLTGRLQLTLGAQWIFDPSNAPGVDALGVLSARFRMSF
jgi:porin